MSYCTDCIHYKVCGNEGVDDFAMIFCADKDNWKELIKRINSISLEELIKFSSIENKCFEKMTNGEVFMSVFPNVMDEEQIKRFFLREWWNAPYQITR